MRRVDFKVVLLGHTTVGKTSLVERFINDRFIENLYRNTIGAAFTAKQIQHDGNKFIMGIWDTAGHEKAKFWIRELRNIEEECKIYLCGTKKDLLEQDAVASPDIDVVKAYAASIQAKVFITSSKTGENVVTLFDEIGQDFISDPKNIPDIQETIDISTKTTKRTCC
ncbi:ras-related protein Rab-24 isoform X3 [Colletes latitarsis]|uniref:ras-related protein Rab-24 isoform X3 n=1 Tax=Colletes latitarsis TaxID=2605962 RepID=UPI004037555A